jgi:hypothetical protein
MSEPEEHGPIVRSAWRGIALAIDVEPVADERNKDFAPVDETPPTMSLTEG